MWTGDQLRAQLKQYDRMPFLDLLATWIECAPDPESVIAFAEKHPDRYMYAVSQMGRLAGFTEKKEVEVDVQFHIRHMSDSQLEDHFRAMAYKLGMQVPEMLELSPAKAISGETESESPSHEARKTKS